MESLRREPGRTAINTHHPRHDGADDPEFDPEFEREFEREHDEEVEHEHRHHRKPPHSHSDHEAGGNILAHSAAALDDTKNYGAWAGDGLEREERRALRRVQNLSTELEDITEVEYRQLRLEKVVLIGVWCEGTEEQAAESLRELAALAETAGSQVLDGVIQRRAHPDPATYLGSGKAKEVADIVASRGADTVIVDDELAPSQRRALEDIVKVKVIDRTTLILDIFAQHAKSREGKAQVELAQLEYLLPRLRGWGESMSRQAGGRVAGGAGIGSRGPGETKIELDRRRIRQRMAKLRRDIAKMKPARDVQRQLRRDTGMPSAVVVGYTNAGKSSLMNRITGAGVLVENALFATLDPTVRHATTPSGREFTISDTVGFVRRLPTELVEAFRSTLEEAAGADLLIHAVDASHEDPVAQVRAVRDVLADIPEVAKIPEIIVLTKIDIADSIDVIALRSKYPGAVAVSNLTGEGLDELMERIDEMLPHPRFLVTALIPYSRGELVNRFHEEGEVDDEEFTSDGTLITGRISAALYGQLAEFLQQ